MSFSKASTGDGVKKLRQTLAERGYFGNETPAAVRDDPSKETSEQKAPSHISSLIEGLTSPQSPQKNTSAYDPSTNEAYMKALAALEQINGAAPTYTPSYEAQLEKLYEQIVGRGDFQYDLNADMLYDQYKTQYQRMGERAMQDTMGQAAGLTGGYGSSYSQGVGQQAYNEYLAQLNNIVPELANQAYGRWQDEGTAMQNQYAMLLDRADDEYGKYTDAYNRWLAKLQLAMDEKDTAYDRGYTDYLNQLQMKYQAERDKVADQQWQQQMDYQAERDAEDDRRWQAEYDLTLKQLAEQEAASGYSGDGGSSVPDGYSPWGYYMHGYTTEEILAAQERAGIDVDGVWGPDTQWAYENGFFDVDTMDTVRADLDALKADGLNNRGAFSDVINASGLSYAEKQKLIREYCH